MKKILLFATIAIGLLAACSENKIVIDETHEFADSKWQRFEPEVFKFDINDTAACYDIYFNFRIDTATFRSDNLPFICTLVEREDYKRTLTTEIAIRNKRGIWLGTPVGQFYEYRRKVREYFRNIPFHPWICQADCLYRKSHLRNRRTQMQRIVL